jgi:hypothetical protein
VRSGVPAYNVTDSGPPWTRRAALASGPSSAELIFTEDGSRAHGCIYQVIPVTLAQRSLQAFLSLLPMGKCAFVFPFSRCRQGKPECAPVRSGLGAKPSFPAQGRQRSGKSCTVDFEQLG